MRKTRLFSTLLLTATLGAAAFGAKAQDKGFYAGAGVGQSFVDEADYDDEDTAFSVFGGYQFNKYFGLEAGYADFGKIEAKGLGPELEADTAYLTAVGSLPITDKFSAYAKAGFHSWNLDAELPGLVGTTTTAAPIPPTAWACSTASPTTSRCAANTAVSKSKMSTSISRRCRCASTSEHR